jgi:HAD superfamily hydrolase (TIGR01484 family)
MRFIAFACDYDGTVASRGKVSEQAIAALDEAKKSGRKLILVTGRERPDLERVFDRLDLFDQAVLENGGLLYEPASKREIVLCEAPNERFVERLQARGVPVSAGKTIVATWTPHEKIVLEVIQELGLELHVIFNKGAVMVLPSGVNKGTGLLAALHALELSPHNCVGVGDAENDHAFLSLCECSAAVDNALPALKERADLVMSKACSEGVEELIGALLEDDLSAATAALPRLQISFGETAKKEPFTLPSYGSSILISGPSGSGKSTVVAKILQELHRRAYQYCIIDPEGDYSDFTEAIVVGDADRAATSEEVLSVLRKQENAVVNLLGTPFNDRPVFFAKLLPYIQELRTTLDRPHWLVLDEAHHLLPSSRAPAPKMLPSEFSNVILVTVHPDHLATHAVQAVRMVLAVGKSPGRTFQAFGKVRNVPIPFVRESDLGLHEVLAWDLQSNDEPLQVKFNPAEAERRRHLRKYAAGDVQEKAFYFRGPDGKLNLRAQNLSIFLQMAEGVDEETWNFHLRNGDYSSWMRTAIKDDDLADEVARFEHAGLPAKESFARVRAVVERRYTGTA